MTTDQQTDWNYLYHERIGIMCGTGEPTPEQERYARESADEQIKQQTEREI